MQNKFYKVLALLIFLGLQPACVPQQTGEAVEAPTGAFIFHNGVILTMDEGIPAQAIAVEDGKILAVGTDDEILSLRTTETVVIDLEGRTLMPGFVDAHTHILNDARSLNMSLDEAQFMALQRGITTIGDLYVDRSFLSEIQKFAEAGFLRLRTSLYLVYNDPCGQVFGDWYVAFPPTRTPGEILRINGVKIFTDGGSCGRPALSFEVRNAEGLGDLWLTQAELNQVVMEAQTQGYQVAIHAIGDRAVEQAQNAIALALDGGPNTARIRMEHVSVQSPEMVARFGELDIVAVIPGQYHSCQPFGAPIPEAYYDWEWPWRDLRTLNPEMKIAWHSDYPFWSISPFIHLYGFVTRKDVQANYTCQPGTWLRDDTLPVAEALSIMTLQSAYALFREHEVGSLAPGKYADLIVLSSNPLTVEAEELKDIRVLVTMVNGRFEYCQPDTPQLCDGFTNRRPQPVPDTRPSELVRWLMVVALIAVPLAGVRIGRARQAALTRWGGVLGILGSVLWGASFYLAEVYVVVNTWLSVLAVLSLLICVVGLWFMERHVRTTRLALAFIGVTLVIFAGSVIWIDWFQEEDLWVLMVLSLLGEMLGLIVFGIANLRVRIFPRLNWVPLAMGVVPILAAFLLSSVWLWGVNWQVTMFALFHGLGWLTMGLMLLKAGRTM